MKDKYLDAIFLAVLFIVGYAIFTYISNQSCLK